MRRPLPLGLLLAVVGWLSLGASPAAAVEVILPSQPDVSPDGKTVVFAWLGDLWTVPIEGGRARRLTTHPGRDQQPKFSPDGQQIAFISDRGLGDQVYLMPARGGEPLPATAHTAGYGLEAWHPDGEQLLVRGSRDHYWKKPERFFRVRATTDAAQRRGEQLVFDDYGAEGSWSPDGKRLLFVREGVTWTRKGYVGSQDAQLWLFDSTNASFTQVLALAGGCRWPLWKPDGSGFYYVSAEDGTLNVWEYDWKSKRRTQRTRFVDDGVVYPALARDGSTLVFRRLFDLYAWRPGNDSAPERLAIRVEADELPPGERRVTHSRASDAAFTADGLEIAFLAGGDVWVMDTELKEPRQVTNTPEEERNPTFTPDGESLYFISDRDGSTDIYRARRGDPKAYWWRNESFPVDRITSDPEVESDLRFAPDGKRLAYLRERGDLWTMTPDGQERRRVLASWNQPDYQWSPDGRWFAYAVFDEDFNRDVWIRPSDGSGTPYNVSRHPDNDANPVWSPDGKLLAFTGTRHEGESDVHYVWLRRADEETDARDRTLAQALEKMDKARKKPSSTGTTTAPAAPTGTGKPASAPTGTPAQAAGTATPTAPAQPATAPPATTAPPTTSRTTPPAATATIDFDGLHERVRRLALANAVETDLVFSPDSKRLAFVTSINGQRGLYAVTFPTPGSAALVTRDTGVAPRWLAEGNQLVWLVQGVPTSVNSSGNSTSYRFTVRQTVDVGGRYLAAFDQCWRVMRDQWYDERMGNRNWDEVRRKYQPAARAAADDLQFSTVVNMMLGELNGSHLGFVPVGSATPTGGDQWPVVTAHLGVRFDPTHRGPGLKIRDVLWRGPADEAASRLVAGELILAIDGTPVDPDYDLTRVLNGPLPRDVKLRVRGGDGRERDVTLRPISYASVSRLLYEQWVRQTRRQVEQASGGRLGYLHIAGMDDVSLRRFEEELFSAASGKSGLIIDVRENGGGYTTDHLLTMLTQPVHAIAVPRGGEPGYPQDRKVYATWNRPIVVLCNQNSFSNAEVFSHAIKTLKRGRLVGVTTAGGVVSTGSTSIMDVGVLRLPFRGWFVVDTGQDMELRGAEPDVIVWPQPGQLPRGDDKQLEAAIRALAEDVRTWENRPRPTLIWATEREAARKP